MSFDCMSARPLTTGGTAIKVVDLMHRIRLDHVRVSASGQTWFVVSAFALGVEALPHQDFDEPLRTPSSREAQEPRRGTIHRPRPRTAQNLPIASIPFADLSELLVDLALSE
jgi:hypothetical protein